MLAFGRKCGNFGGDRFGNFGGEQPEMHGEKFFLGKKVGIFIERVSIFIVYGP